MTVQIKYNCNVCKKPIKEGHQQLYMATVTIEGYEYRYDDGSENYSETYHVHNDFSNHCLSNIANLLNGNKAK